jgi:hypothetical protein
MALASAVGCGPQGDVCDRYQEANSSLAVKGAGCGAGNVNNPSFNTQTCKSNLSQCSATDQQRVSAYTACIDQLATCTGSTVTNWTFSEVTCEANLANVSTNCLSAALQTP